MTKNSFSNSFNSTVNESSFMIFYKNEIEEKIKQSILLIGPKSSLRDACEYALTNGGKRYRPILVLMIAKALEKGLDASDAAMTVEFFHTASLIVDDLPCMDDDDSRRNMPALHKVYGEATALLASFTLMSAGYEWIVKNTEVLEKKYPKNDHFCAIALKTAAYNAGLQGATGGQFLDIYPPDINLETLYDVIQKKQCLSLKFHLFLVGFLVAVMLKNLIKLNKLHCILG